ncbi:ATP-dependent nuclease [Euzebyella saccharophila]|uniref:ATP-dependent endonuclease n=1 Tax=Euzebyella saccharophila TaxID=679664 RepID=A0ABV8JP53_9FLAO|nr:AAA family ATPase [Euzebyella saccharophila]
MKICKLEINNFRGVKKGVLYFNSHNLLVGKNNIGKSTICEALDLVLGPDRLSRVNPIDEYDFYNGEYLAESGENPKILIDAYLIEMSEELKSTFGPHLSFWHKKEERLLAVGEIDMVDDLEVEECLHLKFIGNYDIEEDEFIAKTYYAVTIGNVEEDGLIEIYKSKKRLIGFLYLRALRTGRRALSLERGTLLDILMRVGKLRPKFWEDTRNKLKNLNPPLEDDIGSLRTVLDGIEARIGLYIPLPEDSATSLHVSQLTREHLRQTLSFFVRASSTQTPVPFQKLGTGTLSTLVFSMLSAIAEMKKENVIFAMEEPEIAIPPHTQRRIVSYLLDSTNQSFITSHSPYVIERFQPENINILSKNERNELSGNKILDNNGIKSKTYRSKIRHSIAEAILGNAVIIGEGLCELEVLSIASQIMEKDDKCYPLDLSGVTIFDAGGDGEIIKFGNFFKSIGLKVYAFFDFMERAPEKIKELNETFIFYKQIDYKGLEKLLISEIPEEIQWAFLQELDSSNDLPHNVRVEPDNRPQTKKEIQDIVYNLLKGNKGERFAAQLISMCSKDELPSSITDFLSTIYHLHPKPSDIEPFNFNQELETSEEE